MSGYPARAHDSQGPLAGLVGTGSMLRLAVRRDRVLLPVWIAVFVVMAASSAAATVGLYPTVADRVKAAQDMNGTQSLVAMYGRVYDPTSLGALAMWKMTALGGVFVAVLALISVVRHSRAEEESGRLELLGATVVGRAAPLTAALLLAVGTDLVLAALTALALVTAGLPVAGSIAFGLSWAGTGIAFAAVAAVTAQLSVSARAATGTASALLGLAYLLRATGDAAGPGGPGWLSWLSPVGWGQQVRPYAGNRWWVLLVPIAFAAVTTVGAYVLVSRRDLGAGLLPDRPGRATAAPSLRSPLALAWRLQRNLLFAWAAAFAVMGAVVGNLASSAGNLLNSQQSRDFITKLGGEKGLTDAFLATEMGFIGVIVSVFGVQAAMRLRSEESSQRAEPLLATSVSRTRWAASHLTIAMAGTAVLLLVGGLAAGATHAAHMHDVGQVGRVLGGTLVQLPAAWVLTAIVAAAFGLAPRLTVLGWAALVGFLLIGEVGPLLKLKQWIMDMSPFAHAPKLPGAPFTLTPLLWLLGIAAATTAAGLVGFRRRDIG